MAKTKEVTLSEFKAWLEGVEELQEKTWTPDGKQWRLIRAKIKNIIEPEPVVAAVQPQPVATGGYQPVQSSLAPMAPPTHTPPPGIPQMPMAPSSFPEDVVVGPPSENAKKMFTGDTRKTPDIDTSDGNVSSSFA